MKKNIFILIISCLFFFSACKASNDVVNAAPAIPADTTWKLIFEDQFNTVGNFDQTKWSFSDRGTAAWTKFLTASPDYASQDGNHLNLKMDNKVITGDNIPYHAAGIQTKGKFSFLYGKVEVRAKFNKGKGSWPAIWMMPENSTYGGWPKSGEIDIMEHVNYESVMHQTIHNAAVTSANGSSVATQSSTYNANDFNVYGIVWTAESIKFYVNDVLKYTYSKSAGADFSTWPFDQPFYLILNQSGGAGWPGVINDADLPFTMQVDWVKVYQKNNK